MVTSSNQKYFCRLIEQNLAKLERLDRKRESPGYKKLSKTEITRWEKSWNRAESAVAQHLGNTVIPSTKIVEYRTRYYKAGGSTEKEIQEALAAQERDDKSGNEVFNHSERGKEKMFPKQPKIEDITSTFSTRDMTEYLTEREVEAEQMAIA